MDSKVNGAVASTKKTERANLIVIALLAAFVAAVTLFFRIPIPKTGGYFNFGDIVIIFAGLYYGPWVGLVVGGVGSAFADLIGFPIFAPITFVVKGGEGVIAGSRLFGSGRAGTWIRASLAALFMVAGYFVAETLMPSIGVAGAIAELPFNIAQAIAGVLGGVALAANFRRRQAE